MEGDEGRSAKKGNTLPVWGNEKTMNLNSMVLTNIQSSPYFKNTLYQLKTYHEVVDEIYYKVSVDSGKDQTAPKNIVVDRPRTLHWKKET